MHLIFSVHFLALTFQVLFVGGDWVYHNNYKEATYPYKTLSGDGPFCKDQCNKDNLCNGFTIDMSINGCYLSSYSSYTRAPACSNCYFASKSPTTSPDVCTPTTKIGPTIKMAPTTTTTASITKSSAPTTMTTTTTTPATTTTPMTTTAPTTTTMFTTTATPTTTTTTTTTTTPTTATTTTTTSTTTYFFTTTTMSTSTTTTPTTTIPSTTTKTLVPSDITQIVINTTSCICVCKEVNLTLEESIKNRRTLTVNQFELSSTIRKHSSAPDIRVTSKVIGTVAIIILMVFELFLFLADIISVLSLIFTKVSRLIHID